MPLAPVDRAREIKMYLDAAHEAHPNCRHLAALHRSLGKGLAENARTLGLDDEQVAALGGGTEKDGG